MPGYILHLTEASLILKELKQEGYHFSEEWINAFRLGNLLPDTKRKREKITSHFWNPDSLEQQAIAPDLHLFYKKYRSEKYLSDFPAPVMLGYLAHLHLDACYVNSYWDTLLEFQDEKGHPQTLQKEIRKVWLKIRKTEIPVADFFSENYYYGDYSRMNAYLLHKYQLPVPTYDPNLFCPVEEVQVSDLQDVLQELQYLCDTVKPGAEKDLTVFDLPSLEQFIQETAIQIANQFMDEQLL